MKQAPTLLKTIIISAMMIIGFLAWTAYGQETPNPEKKITSKYADRAMDALNKELCKAKSEYDSRVIAALKKYQEALDVGIREYTKRGDFDRAMICKKRKNQVQILNTKEDEYGFGKKYVPEELAEKVIRDNKRVKRSKTKLVLLRSDNGRWRNAGMAEFIFKLEEKGKVVFQEKIKFEKDEVEYFIPSMDHDKIILEMTSDQDYAALSVLKLVYGKCTNKTSRYKITASTEFSGKFTVEKMLDEKSSTWWMAKGKTATVTLTK